MKTSSQRVEQALWAGRVGLGYRLAGQLWWQVIYLLGSLAWTQPSGICLHDLIKST